MKQENLAQTLAKGPHMEVSTNLPGCLIAADAGAASTNTSAEALSRPASTAITARHQVPERTGPLTGAPLDCSLITSLLYPDLWQLARRAIN